MMILSVSERHVDDSTFVTFRKLSWENEESLMADPAITVMTFLFSNFAVSMGINERCPPKKNQYWTFFTF